LEIKYKDLIIELERKLTDSKIEISELIYKIKLQNDNDLNKQQVIDNLESNLNELEKNYKKVEDEKHNIIYEYNNSKKINN